VSSRWVIPDHMKNQPNKEEKERNLGWIIDLVVLCGHVESYRYVYQRYIGKKNLPIVLITPSKSESKRSRRAPHKQIPTVQGKKISNMETSNVTLANWRNRDSDVQERNGL
jgi:hypothetical protein